MTDPSTRTQKTVTAPTLRAGVGTCPHITATKVQGGFWLESEVVRTDQADCSGLVRQRAGGAHGTAVLRALRCSRHCDGQRGQERQKQELMEQICHILPLAPMHRVNWSHKN